MRMCMHIHGRVLVFGSVFHHTHVRICICVRVFVCVCERAHVLACVCVCVCVVMWTLCVCVHQDLNEGSFQRVHAERASNAALSGQRPASNSSLRVPVMEALFLPFPLSSPRSLSLHAYVDASSDNVWLELITQVPKNS